MGLFQSATDSRWSPVVVHQRSPIEQWRGRKATGDRSTLPVFLAGVAVVAILFAGAWRRGDIQAFADISSTAALVIGGFALFGVVVLVLAFHETPAATIEWDGERVVWRTGRGERELAVARTGSVLRVRLGGASTAGIVQFWLAPDGSVRGEFSESLWDGEALLRCAAAAHVPVTDAGEMTPYEFGQRYPELLPRIGGLPANTPVTVDALKTVVRNEVKGGGGLKPMWHEPRMWGVVALVLIAILWKLVGGH